MRVSDHIVLKPHNKNYESKPTDIVVNLQRGLSFGMGSHPTTRLSLKGIDYIINSEKKNTLSKQAALDIGTGSGVLAITAALFGIGFVHACDIDSVAINETKKNALLNNIDKNFTIKKNIDSTRIYDYILANLRFPTLIDLFPLFLNMTHNHSYLVLSGIKLEEKNIILKKYSQHGKFKKIWEESDNGWVGLIFKRINL